MNFTSSKRSFFDVFQFMEKILSSPVSKPVDPKPLGPNKLKDPISLQGTLADTKSMKALGLTLSTSVLVKTLLLIHISTTFKCSLTAPYLISPWLISTEVVTLGLTSIPKPVVLSLTFPFT